MPLFRIRNQFNSSAMRAIESASRRQTLCFAVRDDDNNSGGGMTVHSSNLPAEVGKPKDLPARSAADVIAEMAAKVARYPAKSKEEWEEMSVEEMCQRGIEHCDKEEYVEAAKWYHRAAEQGYFVAQFNISLMYYKGEGVPQNDAEAVKWLRRAAEQGFVQAQFNLGMVYADGKGVSQDKVEAAEWYRRAAEQGFAGAQINLGLMYAHGEGVPQNKAEAVKWTRRAAEQGDAGAQIKLGWRYATGEGIPQDDVEAVKWFRRAAEQGNEYAQKVLRQFVQGEQS